MRHNNANEPDAQSRAGYLRRSTGDNMRTPEIGDELYLVDSGNRARNGVKHRSCKVIGVGRKYFTVAWSSGWTEQFLLENWRQKTNYMPDYVLYESKQVYEDESLFEQLKRELHKETDQRFPPFNLAQLKQAMEILGLSNKAHEADKNPPA
jgi:hypothetical protein